MSSNSLKVFSLNACVGGLAGSVAAGAAAVVFPEGIKV